MKWLKYITWILIIMAIGLLFYSLRLSHHQLEFALAGLGVWGVAALLNNYLKKNKIEEKKKTP